MNATRSNPSAASYKGKPTPELLLEVHSTGGGTGVDFSAHVSEVANKVPAIGVHLYAELEGEEGAVFEAPSFKLRAGELEQRIRADSGEWRTVKEWAAHLSVPEKRAKSLLDQRAESGHVQSVVGPPGRSSRAHCYRSAPGGRIRS